MESTKIDVVLPAAGVGKRMHLDIPKQYALIGKKTVLELTVDAIFRCPSVNNTLIKKITDAGLKVAGLSTDNKLVEQ